MIVVGAAGGTLGLASCLKDGVLAGRKAVRDLGLKPTKTKVPVASDEDFAIQPFWHVKDSFHNAFVDFQHDVGVKDIKAGASLKDFGLLNI